MKQRLGEYVILALKNLKILKFHSVVDTFCELITFWLLKGDGPEGGPKFQNLVYFLALYFLKKNFDQCLEVYLNYSIFDFC